MKTNWRQILLRCALLGAVGGCLLPPPVSLDQGNVNQAPTVNPNASDPNKAEVELNLACSSCTFKLTADDPDANDSLYVKWFWDYDDGHTDARGTNELGSALNGAERPQAVYTTEALSALNRELANSASGTETAVHTLQAVVSDGPFNPSLSASPVNQVPLDAGRLTTSLRWTVRFITRGTRCDVAQCQ